MQCSKESGSCAVAILRINPQPVRGHWVEGFTLDSHIISSEFLGYDGDYPRFETRRTELGQCVYRPKYQHGPAWDIIETASAFVKEQWSGAIDCVIVPPPSLSRATQPAEVIAKGIANSLNVEYKTNTVVKAVATLPMKNLTPQERLALVSKAIQSGPEPVRDLRVLIIDDVWETGSTMRRVANVLSEMGASQIRALAMTRTK